MDNKSIEFSFSEAISRKLEEMTLRSLGVPPEYFEPRRGAASTSISPESFMRTLRHTIEMTKPEQLRYARYILCNPYSDELGSILTLGVRYSIDVIAHPATPKNEVIVIYREDKPK